MARTNPGWARMRQLVNKYGNIAAVAAAEQAGKIFLGNGKRFINTSPSQRAQQRHKPKKHSPIPTKKGHGKQKEVRRQIGNHEVVRGFNKLTYKPSKGLKSYKQLGNKCIYDTTSTFGYLSNEGVQAVNVLPGGIIAESAEMQSVFENATQNFQTGIAADSYQNFGQAGYNSIKFSMEKILTELRIINQGPTTAELDIYICQIKNSAVGGGTSDPKSCWSGGLAHEEANNSNVTQTSAFQVPSASKQFNINWHVIKAIKISLESGREYFHTYDFKPKRIIDSEHYASYQQVKGLSHRIMIVQRGTLGDSSAATAAAIGNISLCPTKIIGSIRKVYYGRVVSGFNRTVYMSQNFTTGDSHLYEENPESDTVVDTVANIAISALTSVLA